MEELTNITRFTVCTQETDKYKRFLARNDLQEVLEF